MSHHPRPDLYGEPVPSPGRSSTVLDDAIRSFTARLAETMGAEGSPTAALRDLAAAERQAAVERLRQEIEEEIGERVLRIKAGLEEAHAAQTARRRDDVDRLVAEAVQHARADLERSHTAAVAGLIARHIEALRARTAEGADDSHETVSRLLRLTRTLDDARSLAEVLETLAEAVQDDASRAGIVMVDQDGQRPWRLMGFGDSTAGLSGDPRAAGLVARAIQTADTCFLQFPPAPGGGTAPARGLAVPIHSSGRVAAVVYADNTGRTDPEPAVWAEVIEILVRHAGRTVEAMAARQAALPAVRALAADPKEMAAAGGSIPADRRGSPRMRAAELPWVGGAQLLPGRRVSLVNLSAAGALVECDDRLVPNTNVVLQLMGIKSVSRVAARVVRCVESGNGAPRAGRWQGAVVFTEPMRETPRSSYVALPLR